MDLTLGVSLGDPAGIGPQTVELALPQFFASCPGAKIVAAGPHSLCTQLAQKWPEKIEIIPQADFHGPMGQPSAQSGQAALAALNAIIALAKSGQVNAIVTAPISKTALEMAGCHDRGHTSILARELGKGPVVMAFLGQELKVALVTDHVPYHQVPSLLSLSRIFEVTKLLNQAVRLWVAKPRLALAGLNPHAGENSLLGNEESDVLGPAVKAAQASGLDLVGPLPADSVFRQACDGQFDGVVALYHDQGLIPVKMLGMGKSAHVTLGLSVPRTSPDHGTAFDIVGKSEVRPDGMLAALKMAAFLATAR